MKDTNEVIKSFGNEWTRFNQYKLSNCEIKKIFNDYFKIFPFDKISKNSIGFDMGSGTGRWAKLMANRVKYLNCIEPSKAILIAKKKLKIFKNINFINSSIEKIKLPNNSQDFGYCLGVLHHLVDYEKGIKSCTKLLKSGAPFLVYIYYSLDNKFFFYKLMWNFSNILRKFISIMPEFFKNIVTDFLAVVIYFPLARLSFILKKFNIPINKIPLNYYNNLSFYSMRTDSRDRFGTRIEHRLSKDQIKQLLKKSGLCRIRFSNSQPYWCAVGYKK